MTEAQRIWAEARDDLAQALSTQGYPAELADIMAKQLRTPKSIARMTSYVNHGYGQSMEMLADEMMAICADADAWRAKKESQDAQSRYNTYLYYRRMESDDEEE